MMTEEEIDQIVEATSPPPGKWWTAPFRRFATWFATTRTGMLLDRKTKVWNLIVAVLVMAAGYPLVINSIGATNAHLRASDQQHVAEKIYLTQLVAYTNAQNAYSVCLASATAFGVDRERWTKLADALDSAFPTSDGTAIVTRIIRDALGPVDPLTAADCPNPGDPPKPPQ